MRIFIALVVICALASCGGRSARAPAVQFSSGPISAACQAAGRPNASRELCRCIQGVADAELSGSDQRRAAPFFDDPERAQAVRLDDSRAADAFWERWTTYARRAEELCGSLI
ncbi:MAG: arginine transporter [Pseudomonadota bacterium]